MSPMNRSGECCGPKPVKVAEIRREANCDVEVQVIQSWPVEPAEREQYYSSVPNTLSNSNEWRNGGFAVELSIWCVLVPHMVQCLINGDAPIPPITDRESLIGRSLSCLGLSNHSGDRRDNYLKGSSINAGQRYSSPLMSRMRLGG